ncbi:MAG: Type I restriction-modification system, specificity subunit S (EC [uncultured Sulfurovum sp.]|uniref:Type I restriction-modification system, specificity subunit S (EC) n=1 Tax=uncultured Sulfurovum sp. TaxID=269237 RepID=A0A6S6T4H1_9BACT|nr:MAG: Type I restriction-modification system, specificity subunit S (EC [uncultured Sulfurovum sp.]
MSEINNMLFYINLSELENRLDPLFYVAIKKMQKEVVNRSKYECIDLIKACSINRGRFGHRPRNDPRFYGGEYPFVQTGDIVKASENNDSIQYTQTLNELGLGTSKLFHPPKLLFTIAANIGDTAILDYPSCFPDSIVALIPHNDNLSLEYLNIYLKHIKPYIEALAPYSAQKNLNNQQLAQIPLIVPPVEVQEEIVFNMDKVYKLKQEKEAKAEALLGSIDDYLLNELGINLPKYNNNLESRMFSVGLNEITNKRFDPDYYSTHYTMLNKSIEDSYFDIDEISSVVSIIKGGKTPAKNDYSKRGTEFPLIKAGSYTKDFINLKKVGYTKEYNGNEVEKNDIFILSAAHQSQYVGRQIKFLNEIPDTHTSYVGELICIRTIPESCNPMYLFSLLNLEIYKSLLNREKTGQTSHIYGRDIKNIKIPSPPIEKQNEIAQHIEEMRKQAKQLQEEAKKVLESAKRYVEEMILGE